MFHYITRAEYYKQIEEAILDQRRRVGSSREEAAKIIDELGMRHLLIPVTEERLKVLEEEVRRDDAEMFKDR